MAAAEAEAALAVELAHDSRKRRERALIELMDWLKAQQKPPGAADSLEHSLLQVWQGAFYCLWHADTRELQMEVVDSLASAVLCDVSYRVALAYAGVGFSTLRREWRKIDRVRLDKYMSLTRHLLRSMFILCAKEHWKHKRVAACCRLLSHRVLLTQEKGFALGLALHVVDICADELATVARLHSNGEIPVHAINHFVYLFAKVLTESRDTRLRSRVKDELFTAILDHRWSGSEGNGDLPQGPFCQIDLSETAALLTDIGGSKSVPGVNRKDLYAASRLFSQAQERWNIERKDEYRHTDDAGRIVTQLSEPRYELPQNVPTEKAPGSEPMKWPTKRNPFANEIVPDAGEGERRRKREKRKRKREEQAKERNAMEGPSGRDTASPIATDGRTHSSTDAEGTLQWKSARKSVRFSNEDEDHQDGPSSEMKKVKWDLGQNKMWTPKRKPGDEISRGLSKLSESPTKSCLKKKSRLA